MIYPPNAEAGDRFPWVKFLNITKLRKGSFAGLFKDEEFLETVADAYEDKGSMLTDEEIYKCVEKVYFPMFKKMFVSEDVFWAGSFGDDDLAPDGQPVIEGFVFDRLAPTYNRTRRTKLRSALKMFSQDLYNDPHAWFEDFENYFRAQQNLD